MCGLVLKVDSGGSVVATNTHSISAVPPSHVNAVDTTAAGDAFNGGFAVGLMRGYSVQNSAVFASAVAAISVMRDGAQASLPNRDEVERFLLQNSVAISEQQFQTE